MFLFSLIALGLVLAATVLALFSAHIPGLRRLTGAAPLQSAEPDPVRDFAESDRRGYVTRADWGPEAARPRLPELPAPAPKEDAA